MSIQSGVRFVLVAALCLAVWAPQAAKAEPLLPYILQAFAAEALATHERTELIYRRGNRETQYIIERVLPDRLHLQVRGDVSEQELYIVGERMYYMVEGAWQVSSLPAQGYRIPSIVVLFTEHLGQINEGEPEMLDGVAQRLFSGVIAWYAAPGRNEGTIDIVVDSETNLPQMVSFKGQCGGLVCSFEQTFAYDPAIAFEPPVQ